MTELLAPADSLPSIGPIWKIQQSFYNDGPVALMEDFESFSTKQRELVISLSSWDRDSFNSEAFGLWIDAVEGQESPNMRTDLVNHPGFLLYLKAYFQITLQDQEEPELPDHDHFFVSDDQLFLFEYKSDFKRSDEVQSLVRHAYMVNGVETTINVLTGLLGENYSIFEETCYSQKKEQLLALGIPDYFGSIELFSMQKLADIDRFIALRVKQKRDLNSNKKTARQLETSSSKKTIFSEDYPLIESKNQGEWSMKLSELDSEGDINRHLFKAVQTLFATYEVKGIWKQNLLSYSEQNKRFSILIDLAIQYVENKIGSQFTVLNLFDAFDLYKIGEGLSKNLNIKASRIFREQEGNFIGDVFIGMVDQIKSLTIVEFGTNKHDPTQLEGYLKINHLLDELFELRPFILGMKNEVTRMTQENLLQDSFYLNYEVVDIDFESLITTMLFNFINKSYQDQDETSRKMALTLTELKMVWSKILYLNKGKARLDYSIVNEDIVDFMQYFKIPGNKSTVEYIAGVIAYHYEDLDLEELVEDDFKHVGGAILLSTKMN